MNSTLRKLSGLLLLGLISLVSCDPGHSGITTINNASTQNILLKYSTHHEEDSVIIYPNTFVDLEFGGIGSGQEYDCCACEFTDISVATLDTSKNITKSIADEANWILTNPNKRRFSHKTIRCEFVVHETDIE